MNNTMYNTMKVFIPSHTEKAKNRGTVLFVEDEPLLYKIGKCRLQFLGYTTLAAATAEEAIEIAESNYGEIDVLFTDFYMPGSNGAGINGGLLAKYLTGLHMDMQVVITSGAPFGEIKPVIPVNFEYRFLPKPYSFEDLEATMENAMDSISPLQLL